jgi:uncharacterized membrane protein
MITLKKSEWKILFVLIILSLVPSIGGVFRLAELVFGIGVDFLPENPRIQSAPTPVVLHLVGSILYLILGAFQFLPSVRRNYPKWHRLSGRALVFAGIVSSVSGLWMTHYYAFPDSLQGSLLYLVRIVIGFSMVISIFLGVSAVINKRIPQHQAWMIRAYALGLGAGTQVMVAIPWLLTVGEPIGLQRDLLMTAAWMINIAAAEWIIKSQGEATHLNLIQKPA